MQAMHTGSENVLTKYIQLADAEVVNRVIAGEKELYEILMRRNNQTLYRIIRGYLDDDSEIQDAMQNTYLKAFEKLDQFQQEASFSTWLIRIGINEALTRLRQKGKTAIFEGNDHDGEVSVATQVPGPDHLTPESRINRKDAQRFLEQAINQLQPKYRVVFIMKEIEGMDMSEIAANLQISNANVKVRLHRAKAMIKETLLQLADKEDVLGFGNEQCDNLVAQVLRHI